MPSPTAWVGTALKSVPSSCAQALKQEAAAIAVTRVFRHIQAVKGAAGEDGLRFPPSSILPGLFLQMRRWHHALPAGRMTPYCVRAASSVGSACLSPLQSLQPQAAGSSKRERMLDLLQTRSVHLPAATRAPRAQQRQQRQRQQQKQRKQQRHSRAACPRPPRRTRCRPSSCSETITPCTTHFISALEMHGVWAAAAARQCAIRPSAGPMRNATSRHRLVLANQSSARESNCLQLFPPSQG